MHKCLNCGKEFEGKFCPECGTKWVDPYACPRCGARREEGDKFCRECGARLDGKVNCPKCGALMEQTSAFCSECGARLDGKKNKQAVSGEIRDGEGRGKLKQIVALSGIILILLSGLMGLVFTFVSGVSLVATGSGKALETVMLYHYFGEAYKDIDAAGKLINQQFFWSEMGEMREFALYFPAVLGTVVSAVGILGVVALSCLTGFKAYKKYYKKEDANVVAPAVATYFVFVTVATLLLLLNSMKAEGAKAYFSAPTLAGLITGGVLLALGVILSLVVNFKEFKGFNAAVGAVSGIAVSVFAVVVVALVSLPACSMGILLTGDYYDSVYNMEASYGLFTGMQAMLMLIEKDEAITKIIVFATLGGVAGIALAVTCAVTLFAKLSAVSNGKNKSNLILCSVSLVLSVLYLVFTILFNNAIIDALVDAVTSMYGEVEGLKEIISTNYAVPIAMLVMSSVGCLAEFAGKFVRKKEILQPAE